MRDLHPQVIRGRARRYAALGSVWALKEELDRDRIVGKLRVDQHGRSTGGKPLARGALYLMLQNPIYRGQIVHKEASYPGEHEALVDQPLWDEVQRRLAANRVDRFNGSAQPSLLAGLIYDDADERMTPSHANKKGTRYRYYVSQRLVTGSANKASRGRRVPARDLECLVEDRLLQFLKCEADVFSAIEAGTVDLNERMDIVACAADLARRWPDLEPVGKRTIFTTLVDRVDLMRETLEIRIRPGRLPSVLCESNDPRNRMKPADQEHSTITFTVPARLKRAGMETRLLIDAAGDGARRKPDNSLYRLLAQAYRYNEMVMRSGGKTMRELAAETGVGGSYFTRILRLSFLAPEIVKVILRDGHPIELTAKRLANDVRIPKEWTQQRALLATD